MSKKLISLSALCLFLIAAAGLAKADTLYYLNQGSLTLPAAPNNYYGTVTLALDGQNSNYVDVTVQLNDAEFIQTGSHQTFAFYDPSVTSASQITNVAFAPSPGDSVSGPPTTISQSGFGQFTISIDCTNCGNGGNSYLTDPTKLTFTVENVSISSFVANSDNTRFSADIYDNVNGKTGPVGDDGVAHDIPPVVPEPPSLLLLGTGLAALAGSMKFKFLGAL